MSIREKVARAIANTRGQATRNGDIRAADAAINAFLEVAAEQGWHMRPDEATEDMRLSGARDIGKSMREENHMVRSQSCYCAMLTAAPKFEKN